MSETDSAYVLRQTPEQRRAHQAHVRRYDAMRRQFNNFAGFWLNCDKPICRRNRTCSRDITACFNRHWPMVPEEEKAFMRGLIRARSQTRDPAELRRAGNAAVESYRESQARAKAVMTQASAAPIHVDAAEPTARVRRL